MNIWTIKEGEPLPIEECPGRQMRCGIISQMLVERGHSVTWWTSTFLHQTKRRLRNEETIIEINNLLKLHMLHAKTVYKQNISIRRIVYSWQLGKAFKKSIKNIEKPDVIICAFPLIDFAYEAMLYAKHNSIPIIIDVRDMWPDIIWEHFPKFVQGIARYACKFLTMKTDYVMKNADVVIGVIPKCMEFAVAHGRSLKKDDEVYYLAYKEKKLSSNEKEKAVKFWKGIGVNKNDFLICWIGQISVQRTDFEMVCDAIVDIPSCKFIICGDGISKHELENKYKIYDNIIFPGFLNQEELEVLMEMASIGVIPIKNTPDFINTINNKAIEYMAGSLCILTTLKGLLRNIIEENELGFYFENADELKLYIDKMMKEPEILNRYKKNSRKYYENHFTYNNAYGKLCDLIEDFSK